MNRFIEPQHRIKDHEVVVTLQVTPASDLTFHQCLHALAQEFQVSNLRRNGDLYPIFCHLELEDQSCDVILPEQLFESGNLTQHLSFLLDHLLKSPLCADIHIQNIQWTPRLMASFQGPNKGIEGIRNHSGLHERALSSVLITPYSGLSNKDLIERAYHSWMGGIDIVMESVLMASSSESDFYERIDFLSKEQENCHKRTSSPKYYVPHISAPSLEESIHRMKKSKENGLSMVSINGHLIDPMSLNSLRKASRELGLSLIIQQGTQPRSHLSGELQNIAHRYNGADVVGISLNEPELDRITSALLEEHTPRSHQQLRTFPLITHVNPADIPKMIKAFGHDLILQGHNSICEHPDGIKAGAQSFHNALLAASQGISLFSRPPSSPRGAGSSNHTETGRSQKPEPAPPTMTKGS